MGNKGKFVGQEYFSATRPKGQGMEGINYDPRLYKLAYDLVYTPTGMDDYPRDSLKVLQNELVKIGYLDKDNPQSTDGLLGSMSTGAARRYVSNFYSDNWLDETKDMSFWDMLKSVVGYK